MQALSERADALLTEAFNPYRCRCIWGGANVHAATRAGCVRQVVQIGGHNPLLGIPTVSDRIAQMVVKLYLEPILEPIFHEGSYGYRAGRSAHQALMVARQRCWRDAWVLDLDIKGFFDNIDWTLLIRAVRRHTDCKWVLLYVERWLKAPVCIPDGTW